MTSFLPRVFCLLIVFAASHESFAQALPATAGVTLSDKPIVLADAVRGHAVVLIAGFSREGGNGAGDWAKALRADPAFTRIVVYQIAILAGAPKLMRGMIKSGMKKGVAPADQDRFVVLSDDEQPWKSFSPSATTGRPTSSSSIRKGRFFGGATAHPPNSNRS